MKDANVLAEKRLGGPHFVRFFGPVLDALRGLGGSGRPSEVEEALALKLGIDADAQADPLPSGAPRFANQVHWARFYLAKAGLIDTSRRGVWVLTETGRQTKLTHDASLQLFKTLHKTFGERAAKPKVVEESDATEERLDAPEGETEARGNHRATLLALLKSLPASGFERICQRLLRESDFEQVVVTGRSNDGGLDGNGVLQVNPFVSFRVYFQCKRYKDTVGPGVVRDFRGAMMGRADKGIILSTGTFTPDARKEAVRDGVPPIELVDGEKLVEMFEHLELGLTPRKTFDIDEKFFDEFRAAR